MKAGDKVRILESNYGNAKLQPGCEAVVVDPATKWYGEPGVAVSVEGVTDPSTIFTALTGSPLPEGLSTGWNFGAHQLELVG